MSPRLLAAAVAFAAVAPSLSLHAIFSGGQTENIHAGQVLLRPGPQRRRPGRAVDLLGPRAHRAPGLRHHADRRARAGGPADGRRHAERREHARRGPSTSLHRRPASAGRAWSPSTITCAKVGLYGNYDRRRHRSLDLRETMPAARGSASSTGSRRARSSCGTTRGREAGFASERCARRTSSPRGPALRAARTCAGSTRAHPCTSRSSAARTPPAASARAQTSTVGPAPEIVAPSAPRAGARAPAARPTAGTGARGRAGGCDRAGRRRRGRDRRARDRGRAAPRGPRSRRRRPAGRSPAARRARPRCGPRSAARRGSPPGSSGGSRRAARPST